MTKLIHWRRKDSDKDNSHPVSPIITSWLICNDDDMLLYSTHEFYFSSMMALTSIIFAVGFMMYGVIEDPISEENVNNPELNQLDTFW